MVNHLHPLRWAMHHGQFMKSTINQAMAHNNKWIMGNILLIIICIIIITCTLFMLNFLLFTHWYFFSGGGGWMCCSLKFIAKSILIPDVLSSFHGIGWTWYDPINETPTLVHTIVYRQLNTDKYHDKWAIMKTMNDCILLIPTRGIT